MGKNETGSEGGGREREGQREEGAGVSGGGREREREQRCWRALLLRYQVVCILVSVRKRNPYDQVLCFLCAYVYVGQCVYR